MLSEHAVYYKALEKKQYTAYERFREKGRKKGRRLLNDWCFITS